MRVYMCPREGRTACTHTCSFLKPPGATTPNGPKQGTTNSMINETTKKSTSKSLSALTALVAPHLSDAALDEQVASLTRSRELLRYVCAADDPTICEYAAAIDALEAEQQKRNGAA